MDKKREILPLLMSIIEELSALGEDAAKLEYYDNDQASRRLKYEFIRIRDNSMVAFHKHILSIREEINNKYNQSKNKKR